jgi:hypothetical protein
MPSRTMPSRKNPSPDKPPGRSRRNESPQARERRLAAARRYQKTHRKQFAINTANWRARKQREDPAYRERRRAYNRSNSRKRLYGLSDTDYEKMLARQGGRCALCRRKPEQTRTPKKSLSVDHSHATRKVRGLLCNNCNSLLGFAGDDANVLVRGASFLIAQGGKRPLRKLLNALNRLAGNTSLPRSARSKSSGSVSPRRRGKASRRSIPHAGARASAREPVIHRPRTVVMDPPPVAKATSGNARRQRNRN